MSNRRTESNLQSDDLLNDDDVEPESSVYDDFYDEYDEKSIRSRRFNMSIRHRIEQRLEEHRLQRELEGYESFNIDDDDALH